MNYPIILVTHRESQEQRDCCGDIDGWIDGVVKIKLIRSKNDLCEYIFQQESDLHMMYLDKLPNTKDHYLKTNKYFIYDANQDIDIHIDEQSTPINKFTFSSDIEYNDTIDTINIIEEVIKNAKDFAKDHFEIEQQYKKKQKEEEIEKEKIQNRIKEAEMERKRYEELKKKYENSPTSAE